MVEELSRVQRALRKGEKDSPNSLFDLNNDVSLSVSEELADQKHILPVVSLLDELERTEQINGGNEEWELQWDAQEEYPFITTCQLTCDLHN